MQNKKGKDIIIQCIKKEITKTENHTFVQLAKIKENEIYLAQLKKLELYARTHLTGSTRGEKVTYICEECGKEFTLYKYRSYEGRRFCSHNCYVKNKSKVALGTHLRNTTSSELTNFLGQYHDLIYSFIYRHLERFKLKNYADEQYSEFIMRLPATLDYIKKKNITQKSAITKIIKLVTEQNAIKLYRKVGKETFIEDCDYIKKRL